MNNFKTKRFIKNKKIWFVDIPRTSSTSIRLFLCETLGKYYGKYNVFDEFKSRKSFYPDHLTTAECILFLGVKTWDKINKFTVVRNSWSRFYSVFGYLHTKKKIPSNLTFSDFILKAFKIFSNKDSKFDFSPKILIPQVSFLKKPDGLIDNSIKIIKFENRTEDLSRYFNEFDIKFNSSEKLMASNLKNDYRNVYTDFEADLVAKMYAEDIAKFDFRF